MIVILAGDVILSLLLSEISAKTILVDVIMISIDLYSIAVVYALYRNFKTESDVGFSAQYQQSVA